MGRKKAPETSNDESGRDTRLKLILLAVALVLVAGYAAWVTDMGSLIMRLLGGMLTGGTVMLFAWLGAVAIAAASAYVVIMRRKSSKPHARKKRRLPVEAASVPLSRVERGELRKRLEAQIDIHAKVGRQLAVHLIDIDRFGLVNEMLGEEEGDAFLRLMSERLLVLVNHPERLARIGDDEFAIIQPETGGARHAEIYARRIEETVKDACAQVPRHARPGASIGIAVFPEHGENAVKLMHSASLALAAEKRIGGEGFMVYSREMEMEVEARLQMEQAISDGLHHGWFVLEFQPQYDLITRRLTGFEALVRMNHPEQGMLPPAAFLPIAEQSGLIQPLGDWIVREALTTAKDWPDHITLAINLSLTQLRHGDTAGAIINLLPQAGIEGTRLRVEISEAVMLEESDHIAEQLQRLKSRGVTIVLDDFGLERSRLRSLPLIACDAVKIDESLISRVGQEPEVENLVRGLIGTAQAFALDVLAEGVERPEQAHFLLSNECQNVQGFLFGRPTPVSELAAIIAKDMRKAAEGDGEARAPSRSVA